MSYDTIGYEVEDRIAVITLNRPEKLNPIGARMRQEAAQAFAAAEGDPAVRVVVVAGAGDRAFSSGFDMKENGEKPKDRSVMDWRRQMEDAHAFSSLPWRCSKPVIAMIHGYCLAGALEFAQMCDIRYCADDAEFGAIEARWSNGLATLIMPWIIGPHCRELIYTGDRIDAQEALRIGLVSRVFPRSALRRETMKIAARMARVAASCLQWNKRALNHSYEVMGLHQALHYGMEACTLMDAQGSPEYAQFDEIRRSKGLGEAIKWRDAQFAPYE